MPVESLAQYRASIRPLLFPHTRRRQLPAARVFAVPGLSTSNSISFFSYDVNVYGDHVVEDIERAIEQGVVHVEHDCEAAVGSWHVIEPSASVVTLMFSLSIDDMRRSHDTTYVMAYADIADPSSPSYRYCCPYYCVRMTIGNLLTLVFICLRGVVYRIFVPSFNVLFAHAVVVDPIAQAVFPTVAVPFTVDAMFTGMISEFPPIVCEAHVWPVAHYADPSQPLLLLSRSTAAESVRMYAHPAVCRYAYHVSGRVVPGYGPYVGQMRLSERDVACIMPAAPQHVIGEIAHIGHFGDDGLVRIDHEIMRTVSSYTHISVVEPNCFAWHDGMQNYWTSESFPAFESMVAMGSFVMAFVPIEYIDLLDDSVYFPDTSFMV